MDAYVARQPIFNRQKKIYGYELLYRNAEAKYVQGIDGDEATATLLGNSFLNIGIDTLIGGKKSFINFTQNLLLNKAPLLLPSGETVVEILENVDPTPELIAACREISSKGYTIALDDFVYKPELEPLIETADILKFDFRLSSPDEISAYLKQIEQRDTLHLLAEKVETQQEFELAKEMGFNYFQGFFFCKPELIRSRQISGAQLNLLQLMAAVNQPGFNFDDLERLITPDVGLSYKLLRYINSAFFAKAQEIVSIQQALVYMGESEIRRFVSLIAMSNLGQGKPDELIRISCIRGKFCELLATAASTPASPAELFTLGMFSLLDAILDQPMAQIMRDLPLGKNIKDALVNRKGELLGYLGLMEFYEKGLWPLVHRVTKALQLPMAKLPAIYREACEWANTFTEND
ncbi:MAG: HDOD domain-containing protein [Desulfatitalea sp.]|nr:HDOD domain-containing protein [Desulfatitalea sp.]